MFFYKIRISDCECATSTVLLNPQKLLKEEFENIINEAILEAFIKKYNSALEHISNLKEEKYGPRLEGTKNILKQVYYSSIHNEVIKILCSKFNFSEPEIEHIFYAQDELLNPIEDDLQYRADDVEYDTELIKKIKEYVESVE